VGGGGARLVALLLLVGEELDGAGGVGEVVVLGDHPQRARAAGEDVQAPVVHALEHLGDLHRAADRPQPVLGGPHDPELALALQALADHRQVARLEDVQRHELVGQRYEAQREQREVADDAVGHPARV
jgi:hypothetical protein